MPTIKDVAREAGVSTATVSAVVNQSTYVSEALRERVVQAVQKLGYAPDGIARSLKQGRTRLIGLVIADITNPFFTRLTQVIEQVAHVAGYSVLLCDAGQDFPRECTYLRLLRTYKVDGIILSPCGEAADYDPGEMLRLRTPTVLVDRTLEPLAFDAVVLDNADAALQATRHILSFGHRRVAMIAGPAHLSAAVGRTQGFERALAEQGIEPPAGWIRDGRFSEEEAYQACRDILASAVRPTAMFVASNHMLIGVMRALAALGLRCPDDVSVASIDDFPWAHAVTPQLTTVRQPVEAMGRDVVRSLLERIAGSDLAPRRFVHKGELLIRRSVAAPSSVVA